MPIYDVKDWDRPGWPSKATGPVWWERSAMAWFLRRDSDAAAPAVDCEDNPVPQDRQARAESIAPKDAR